MHDRWTVIGEITTWMQVKLALLTAYVRILVLNSPLWSPVLGQINQHFVLTNH